MARLDDPEVRALLEAPHPAVICTLNADGSPLSTVVWIALEPDGVSVNSAIGRTWATNLERDPRLSVLVYDQSNPLRYVEIRGRAEGTTDGADEHNEMLSRKYAEESDSQPGEQRIRYSIAPERVRLVTPQPAERLAGDY